MDTTTLSNGSVLLISIGFVTLRIFFTFISKLVSKFSNVTLRLPDILEVIGEEMLTIEHFITSLVETVVTLKAILI